jgi:hypothetical protein
MSGESGAGHQLDLVEDHQWQDDEAQGLAGEQHARHRDAGDEALFRAAEHDRDLVLARKAQAARRDGGDCQYQREQRRLHGKEDRQWSEGELVPNSAQSGAT